MRTMQFTEENIGEILRLLAGILHAGNIEFMTAGGAQVSSKSGPSSYVVKNFVYVNLTRTSSGRVEVWLSGTNFVSSNVKTFYPLFFF